MAGQPSLSAYAGDLDPREAWALLAENRAARLIDVRTAAEWSFVGIPDLSSLGHDLWRIEWQSYPGMGLNPNFTAEVEAALERAGGDCSTPLLFLCRTGGRSQAAAMTMTQAGFSRAYNIAQGFEGDLDEARHRGSLSGWKATGLPWRQN
jgi:rhodanese-related sulfurtransferase